MRKSMSTLTLQYSANRTVREYTEKYYLPAAAKYRQRAAEDGAAGRRIVAAHQELKDKWAGLHFGEGVLPQSGDDLGFHLPIGLNGIDPEKLTVEVYADGLDHGDPERIPMKGDKMPAADGLTMYHAALQTKRPPADYTVRIIPKYEDIVLPLEDTLIRWQR
jgi:starch phosphorylase